MSVVLSYSAALQVCQLYFSRMLWVPRLAVPRLAGIFFRQYFSKHHLLSVFFPIIPRLPLWLLPLLSCFGSSIPTRCWTHITVRMSESEHVQKESVLSGCFSSFCIGTVNASLQIFSYLFCFNYSTLHFNLEMAFFFFFFFQFTVQFQNYSPL